MKSLLLLSVCFILVQFNASAQGCVAIRSNGSSCTTMGYHYDADHKVEQAPSWTLGVNTRYFKSFRHYKGTVEQKERLVQHSEVINHQTAVDFALTRTINDRWSFMIDVPVLGNARSSLYEHGLVNGAYVKKERRSTHSFGIGDIRLAAYRWLLNPAKSTKGNIQLGLGLKLPTGDYDYKDYWYNVGPGGAKELRTVDQSIQLGDGGTGITMEVNGFYNASRAVGFYGNFYYLSNPREQNGTRTYRETLAPSLANEAIMSVPDQYMARAGVDIRPGAAQKLTFTAGARLEGIPVHDLIGGSGDFRRPGYIISAEPGVTYRTKNATWYALVPVALVRNRTQSVTDKEASLETGTFKQGDAAFADYSINVGVSFSLR